MLSSACDKKVLLTGGLGYIGSHAATVLVGQGYHVTLFDNLDNSCLECLDRLKKLAGERADHITFVKGDIRDMASLQSLFKSQQFDAVIHLAGRKSVGESMEKPLVYYDHNVMGTLKLLTAMQEAGCCKLVFSSSATVYGNPQCVPLGEDHPLSPINPYGRTKLIVEDTLRDLAQSDPRWSILLLRYFNPAGAHPSGEIGEHPQHPTNLVPAITQAVLGGVEQLNVFGCDYRTEDGTAVRDYIHIMDLAEGHERAVRHLLGSAGGSGCKALNLGTGQGSTVMQVIQSFESASRQTVPVRLAPRRLGDAEACYAAVELAEGELEWKACRTLHQMCRDHWRWVCKNPKGYLSAECHH